LKDERRLKWRLGLPFLFTMFGMASGATAEMNGDGASALWSGSIAARTTSPSRITIEGVEVDGRFVPRAASIPDNELKQPSKVSLPLGENLIDRLKPRAFSSEERAEAVQSNDGLAIGCSEGSAPAGIVLETGAFHFPRGARLRLVAGGQGSGKSLGLSIIDRGGDAPPLEQVPVGANGVSLQLPPIHTDNPPALDVILNCPPGQGSFRLNSLSLEPDLRASLVSHTGTWLWEADAWLAADPRLIEDWTVAFGLDRVFLQLKIDNAEIVGETALAELIGHLGKRGISVHAVEGDPAMVTADGLTHALQRVAAIGRYQSASPPETRLTGLQFDIEPYLLADFARDPATVWGQWAAAIQSLSSAWGEPVSVVVPFWMLGSEAGRVAAATARPAISDVSVMAYRTDPGEVTALSEPWLAWGALNNVPVSVAIENGSLGVEIHRTFVRAETGNVLLKMEGPTGTVSLFSEPVEARRDELAYAFHHEIRVNPARISFMNNRDKLAVARTELARLLVAWPSFDGLMIHGLDETGRGAGGPRMQTPEARADERQAPDPDL
jgi:hypothetical protein